MRVYFRFNWNTQNQVLAAMIWLALALGSPVAYASDKPLRLSSANLAPLMTKNGDGYLNRILDNLFVRSGLQYKVTATPPRRGLVDANYGLLDGDVARTKTITDEFPNLIAVPEPIISVVFAGVFLNELGEIRTLNDFNGYRVGHVRGWKIAEAMFEGFDNVEAVRNATVLMQMLEKNRIDVAFLSIAPAKHIANEIGMDEPKVTSFRIKRDLFLYLHQSHAGMIPNLLESLRAMKDDGTYDTILDGYVPEG